MPEAVSLFKFLVVIAAAMGTVLGTAKIIGGALARRPEPIREYDTRFQDGEKRMDRLERQLGEHDRRFGDMVGVQTDLRVQIAELRPMFQAMQDKVIHLKSQFNEVGGALSAILDRLPPSKSSG